MKTLTTRPHYHNITFWLKIIAFNWLVSIYENSVAFSSSHYSFNIQQYSVHIVHLSLFISISLHKKERRKDLKIWSMMIIDDSIHCQCRVHCYDYDTTCFSVDVDTAGITCAFSFFLYCTSSLPVFGDNHHHHLHMNDYVKSFFVFFWSPSLHITILFGKSKEKNC